MASPRTRKVLKEVRAQDENNVSPLSLLLSVPQPAYPLLYLGATHWVFGVPGPWPEPPW